MRHPHRSAPPPRSTTTGRAQRIGRMHAASVDGMVRARLGLGDDDHTGGPQPGDDRGVALGHPVRALARLALARQTGDVDPVLHRRYRLVVGGIAPTGDRASLARAASSAAASSRATTAPSPFAASRRASAATTSSYAAVPVTIERMLSGPSATVVTPRPPGELQKPFKRHTRIVGSSVTAAWRCGRSIENGETGVA